MCSSSSGNIADNLKHEFLIETTQSIYYYDLHYGAGSNEFIRTLVEPLELTPEPEQVTYTANDRKYLNKSVLRKTKVFTFYCGQEKLRDFQSKFYTFASYVDDIGYASDVLPTPRITELSGSDLFKIEIDFIYNIQNVYIS